MDRLEIIEQQEAKRWDRCGSLIVWFDYNRGDLRVVIERFSIKAPDGPGTDWFVTVVGSSDDGGPVVAFHGSETLKGLLVGLMNRIDNGQLKWRSDEYRK